VRHYNLFLEDLGGKEPHFFHRSSEGEQISSSCSEKM